MFSIMKKIEHQRLKYIGETPNIHRTKNGKKVPFAIYQCECGELAEKNKAEVNRGRTRSCGKCNGHYMRHTRFYAIWRAMKTRCNNPNYAEYHYYGGRGIKVCERWQKFENFRDDLLESYNLHARKETERQTTIDRYPDMNGNYEPNNVRWATYSQQVKNKRVLA